MQKIVLTWDIGDFSCHCTYTCPMEYESVEAIFVLLDDEVKKRIAERDKLRKEYEEWTDECNKFAKFWTPKKKQKDKEEYETANNELVNRRPKNIIDWNLQIGSKNFDLLEFVDEFPTIQTLDEWFLENKDQP